MAIVVLTIYLFAIAACITAAKVWHRVATLIVLAILTYFVCSAIMSARLKVHAVTFWHHHSRPLKSFLSAVRSDVSAGDTNAAIKKLDVALSQADSFAIFSTNVTMRTINQELEISEQHGGQVSSEGAASAPPNEPSP